MKFYIPKFKIATLEEPQSCFRSKFGGLPWGLPLDRWSRCQNCGRLMSLLAQLSHDPPAFDLGGADHVLHLFQCQECFGCTTGDGNYAIMVPFAELGNDLTQIPVDEDSAGIISQGIGTMVGELWIDGWSEMDDGLGESLADDMFDPDNRLDWPDSMFDIIYTGAWRTKFGGLVYPTANGPQERPWPGYKFLFQLDEWVEFQGTPPTPDEIGSMVCHTAINEQGNIGNQECVRPHVDKKRLNAPMMVDVNVMKPNEFNVNISNFGTDGTAFVFINRESKPASVYWYWTR